MSLICRLQSFWRI